MKEEVTIEEIDNCLAENALTVSTDINKLSLEESPFTNKQLLSILQKTPAKHIHKRPAKGGGEWEYVTGTYVKKVLNYVFGWMWDFQIVDKGKEGEQLWVQGRLTIRDKNGDIKLIKEQFGHQDLKKKKDGTGYLDYGNDLKGASTDALKKCASELGIASDVYGKNEFKEISPETKSEILKSDDPITSGQVEIIQTLMNNRKIKGASVTMYLKKYEVTSIDKLTKGLAVKVIKDLSEGK